MDGQTERGRGSKSGKEKDKRQAGRQEDRCVGMKEGKKRGQNAGGKKWKGGVERNNVKWKQ